MREHRLLILVLALAAALAAVSPRSEADGQPPRRYSPPRGAVVAAPPLLRWRPVRNAEYYNVQLYRRGRKVLSRWPTQPRFHLRRSWRFRGRWNSLRPAVYRWYVWPNLGRRYGRLYVAGTFVVGRAPANTSPPAIAGTAREGRTLAALAGRWMGTPRPRLSYEWRRCDAAGSGCVPIAGARSATYDLVAEDIDHALRVVVVGSNLVRSLAKVSSPAGPVVPAPPRIVSAPAIVGRPQEGQVLVAVNGTWTSSRPVAYSFRWQRCRVGVRHCTTIPGATRQAYTLAAADLERRVRVRVTAANAGGAGRADSPVSRMIGRFLVGTPGADVLGGSFGADVIRAGAGDDLVAGRGGEDVLFGGRGADRISGGLGDDVIVVRDRGRDVVTCGRGRDRVRADGGDLVDRSCELVTRR